MTLAYYGNVVDRDAPADALGFFYLAKLRGHFQKKACFTPKFSPPVEGVRDAVPGPCIAF
jgi:hypothetical protein